MAQESLGNTGQSDPVQLTVSNKAKIALFYRILLQHNTQAAKAWIDNAERRILIEKAARDGMSASYM